MKNARLAVITTVAVAVVAGLLSMLVPVPEDENKVDFYSNLVVSLTTMILYIGGAVIIVSGFKGFTSQFRRAYTVIFAGSTLWALGYLQLPLLVLTGLIHNDAAVSITVLPYIASALLVFAGTRMLAKLVAVQRGLTFKWWFMLASLLFIAAATVLLPHPPLTDWSEEGFDSVNALFMSVATIFGLATYNMLLVKRQIGVAFTNAFAWLCISMITVVMSAIASTIATFVSPATDQLSIMVALVPSCVAAALFLRSAYSFSGITTSDDVEGAIVARNFFGKPLQTPVEGETTSLDIVLYAAGLASNPQAIDAQLEVVRSLTSQLQGEQKLGEQDENTLMDTYSQIEEYLLHKEPVRVFTKESLRQDIAQKLRLTADRQTTFWAHLT
jgi:hypothetical protein